MPHWVTKQQQQLPRWRPNPEIAWHPESTQQVCIFHHRMQLIKNNFNLSFSFLLNQGMEVSTIIVKQKDLGCNAAKVHIIDQDKEINDAQTKLFWKTLGGKAEVAGVEVIICRAQCRERWEGDS